MDADFYADIAVASGSDLTIVHGRGQAYPWDLAKQFGIQRPKTFVATRQMPFAISAMTTGRFGNKRGETLALLSQDGNIYHLEPNHQEKLSSKTIRASSGQAMAQVPFAPNDADIRNLATFAARQISQEEAEKLAVPMVDTSEIKSGNLADSLKKKQAEAIARYKSTDKKELERLAAERDSKSLEQREKAKAGFLRTISGRPSTLSNWKIETLTAGSQFANAATSNISHKMMRVNFSDSDVDDLLVLDASGNKIQLVSQVKDESKVQGLTSTKVTALETEGNPLAVMPMRLNMDALSDLVVLRQGSLIPSIVMTAPSTTLTVTSTDDMGDCQPAGPCSLRNAILYANSHDGVETIDFDLGGPGTITPAAELPTIIEAVNIFGSVDGGTLQPEIEISGINVSAPANGEGSMRHL